MSDKPPQYVPADWYAALLADNERLRAALKPFADFYDRLERNNYLEGMELILRQDGKILGHAGFAQNELRVARHALDGGKG